jgi:hypothetical protein
MQKEKGAKGQTMKLTCPNEDGIAYGYLMISIFLLAAIFIWMLVGQVFNTTLASVINPDIVSGGISMQTRNAIDWNVNIIRYCPTVILLCGFVFAVNRAIYKRGGV